MCGSPGRALPGGRVAAPRAATRFTAFRSETPKPGEAPAAVRTADAGSAATLPAPRVAPDALLSGTGGQRAPWVAPAAYKKQKYRQGQLFSGQVPRFLSPSFPYVGMRAGS